MHDTLVAIKVTEMVLEDRNQFGKQYREKTPDIVPERTKAEIFQYET